eukprot:scaffold33867_cov154-Amphora_coffeaeformis.AAC.2
MLTNASRRAILPALVRGGQAPAQLRLASTMLPPMNNKDDKKEERRKIHSTARRAADATASTEAAPAKTSPLVARFTSMAEVTISKIFPAGFGWQTASVVADGLGYQADSLNFALTTGLGDGLGVLAGHTVYYAGKKALTGSDSINMTQEMQTGFLLGTAAFCSGTAWQPIVNALQGANLPFNSVFMGTWAGCGVAFYLGLRVGRTILSGPMKYIEEPTYENQKNDASLSAAIGGATAFFVGTDVAYLPEQNFLIGAVGIQDGTPDIVGSAIAGTSTSMGFCAAQSTFNMIYPAGRRPVSVDTVSKVPVDRRRKQNESWNGRCGRYEKAGGKSWFHPPDSPLLSLIHQASANKVAWNAPAGD